MATRLEAATPAHAEAVERALLKGMDARMPSTRWRRLFEPRWGGGERPLGSVLYDGDRIVGFAAFIHARLPRAEAPDAWLCNISSWVTAPGYAAQALSLVMPAFRLPQTTITNLTPIPSVHAIFLRLGFVPLETGTLLLWPAPLQRSRWVAVATERELSRIVGALPAWEARIASDHDGLVRHLLLRGADGRHCYTQYQMTRRRGFPAAKILWITPGTMPDVSLALRRALFRASGALLVELEQRMAGPDAVPASRRRPLPQPRLFRPAGLGPAEVPSAYSELPLLGI